MFLVDILELTLAQKHYIKINSIKLELAKFRHIKPNNHKNH